MKNPVIIVALAALAVAAIAAAAWSWLAAVVAIAVAVWLTNDVRMTTRIQLVLVASLAGGLSAEIVRTMLPVFSAMQAAGSMYRQVMIASLGSAVIVLVAIVIEHLLARLLSRGQ